MPKAQITAEAGDPTIVVTGEFEAPRELIFRAYTDPELLPRWLGPRQLTMTVDRLDATDGGAWRWHEVDENGEEFAFRGYFHGTPGPDRMVQTFEYEGMPGHVRLDTTTMEEHDGRTVVTTVSSFPSVQDRDAVMAAGMEWGVRESDERLAELMQALQAG